MQRVRAIGHGAERWLIAAFLLLFGAAAVASLPVSSSLPAKEQARSTNDLHGPGQAQRELRAVVRALAPRSAGGGKDLVSAPTFERIEAAFVAVAFFRNCRGRSGLAPKAFRARAPPVLMA